jgi:hypothetical protein
MSMEIEGKGQRIGFQPSRQMECLVWMDINADDVAEAVKK